MSKTFAPRKQAKRVLTGVMVAASVVAIARGSIAAEPQRKWDTSIWSDWDLKPTIIESVVMIGLVREALNKFNLHDTYSKPRPQVTADGSPLRCTGDKIIYRQNDGTCNDLQQGLMGSAGSRFGRNVKDLNVIPREIDEAKILQPNPLEVSRLLLARPTESADDDSYRTTHGLKPGFPMSGVNMLAAAWIQFENHDWFSHGDNENNLRITAPYRLKDPGAGPFDLSEMILPRTAIDRTRAQDDMGFPTFTNENTHWWDGSQIYGSELSFVDCKNKPANNLRACWGGLMKLDGQGLLPIDGHPSTYDRAGKELTGFNRNWWSGLSLLHTLFVRNHNHIAEELQKKYGWHPVRDDEKLFHTARLINVATMAKIHTVEWTPGILANPALNLGMRSNWYGVGEEGKLLGKDIQPQTVGMLQKFCLKAQTEVGKELCAFIGGLVGGHRNLSGVPYSLTEEFTAVYRLHSLLPENLQIRTDQGIEKVAMADTREKKSHIVVEKYGLKTLASSMGAQYAGALVLGNYPRFLRQVSVHVPIVNEELKFDMGAVDILRDRERGVPRYNEFRRQLGLKPIRTFEDLMPQTTDPTNGVGPNRARENREMTRRMKEVYHGDVEAIDLLVGTLAEGYRPRGYGFGETLFQVFVLMASRRLSADRFFTDYYKPEYYTELGMKMIDDVTLKNVIVTNFGISPDVIPDNAFKPWPTAAKAN